MRSGTDRRPLHEVGYFPPGRFRHTYGSLQVFTLLIRGIEGRQIDLPDFTSILPYIGLYSLVALHPEALDNLAIPTLHFPRLSMIQDTRFVPAPAHTSPLAPNAARIFDVLSLPNVAPLSPGLIPLSSSVPGFNEQRYWRLPVQQGVILESMMQRAISIPANRYEEIQLSRAIYSYLTLQSLPIDVVSDRLDDPGPGNSGGTGGNGQGGSPGQGNSGGTGGGGRSMRKRKEDKNDDGPPAKSTRRESSGRKKTAGRVADEEGTTSLNSTHDDFGECVVSLTFHVLFIYFFFRHREK